MDLLDPPAPDTPPLPVIIAGARRALRARRGCARTSCAAPRWCATSPT
ncbi:hypothetical protein NKH77_46985 [Streptomyces sp. M19]